MRYFLLYIKGVLMGAADLVPGVSGGTIALITGVYRELLESINNFSLKKIKLLKNGRFKEFWNQINGSFLLSLFSGILSSILLLSRVLEWLINNEPIALWSFFLGLLTASILYLIKTELKYNLNSIFFLLVGCLISFFITQLSIFTNELPIWYIFIAGFFGISAMILPGLSGAYILVLMGVYKEILSTVRKAQDLVFNFNQEQFFEVTSTLSIFILGILLGIKVFSKLLSWLLNYHHETTFAFLIGLMIGALGKVWPWKNQILNLGENDLKYDIAVLPQNFDGSSPEIEKSLILMFLGFILVFVLEQSKILSKNET
jgi:putative membrane protein